MLCLLSILGEKLCDKHNLKPERRIENAKYICISKLSMEADLRLQDITDHLHYYREDVFYTLPMFCNVYPKLSRISLVNLTEMLIKSFLFRCYCHRQLNQIEEMK